MSIQDVIMEGHRLTGGFHVSEDQRAIASLRRMDRSSVRLRELASGRGIFRGPIFSRMFVDNRSHGEPYVSAQDIVNTDVTPAGYLSRKHGRLLDELRLHEGMILVTCSGMNLGKVIWARSDFNGLVASHDLIRIEPDPTAILPGYLFAFLASRYGRALIRKQIYGGHIKHIEPEHIANLPVPRLEKHIEIAAHSLINSVASSRADATQLLQQARDAVHSLLMPSAVGGVERWSQVAAKALQSRMDAYYFSQECLAARQAFDGAEVPKELLGAIAHVFIPGIFKRRYVGDQKFGYPYVTGGDVFQVRPNSVDFLMHHVAERYDLVVSKNTILIQEAGQLGGLIGKCAFVGDQLSGHAVSNNMVRVIASEPCDAGYLFALLSTHEGTLLLSREAAGSSIPHLDAGRVAALSVPWPDERCRREIGQMVLDAVRLRDDASTQEDTALKLIEDAIEKGAN